MRPHASLQASIVDMFGPSASLPMPMVARNVSRMMSPFATANKVMPAAAGPSIRGTSGPIAREHSDTKARKYGTEPSVYAIMRGAPRTSARVAARAYGMGWAHLDALAHAKAAADASMTRLLARPFKSAGPSASSRRPYMTPSTAHTKSSPSHPLRESPAADATQNAESRLRGAASLCRRIACARYRDTRCRRRLALASLASRRPELSSSSPPDSSSSSRCSNLATAAAAGKLPSGTTVVPDTALGCNLPRVPSNTLFPPVAVDASIPAPRSDSTAAASALVEGA